MNGTATGVNTGLITSISNPNRRKDLHDTPAEPDQESKRICQESGHVPHEHQDMLVAGTAGGSEAPSPRIFLDSISIGKHGQTYADASLGSNNPMDEVWKEAQDI